MTKYSVDVSESAENDLHDIARYISAQLSVPTTVLKMMGIFEAAISGLVVMPQKNPAVTDKRLAMLGYHKLPVENYIVFFTIDEKSKAVNVERILFARRDWQRIL